MTVFLNLLIKKMNVYMELPDDYKKNRFVVLLYKTLYDLKQSANQWFKTLKKLFIELGFTQLQLDTAVFIKNIGMDYIIVAAVYINNILLIRSSKTVIKMAKKELKRDY